MEKIKLGKSGLLVPPIALGCMRLAGAERTQADAFLHTALELELNFFDHADICLLYTSPSPRDCS